MRPALTDFIERVIARRAEGGDIAAAKTADAFAIERRFAGGQKLHLFHCPCGKLGFGIEAADGVQLFAKEIQPQGQISAGWPQIDNAAAQRKISRLAHRAAARIAILGQKGDELFAVHTLAAAGEEAGAGDSVFWRHALESCIHRGDDDGGFAIFFPPGKGCQCGEAAAFNIRFRGQPVVGQTIPTGEGQHGQCGIEEAQTFFNRRGVDAIGGHEQHKPAGAARGFGGEIGLHAFGRAGDRETALRAGNIV